MRNLKKVLSLTLALVMMLGMMTFAGAAETKKVTTAADLTDMDKVVNKEAVSLLVDLKIVAGRDTGAFDPAGTLKRGEFAKMICVSKLGSDKGANLAGGASPLTDIKGHWAEGYIKYCYSTKIVSGTSATTFTPDGELKVVEAAKMLLTALGYDATLSKYNNDPFWSSNIMTDAQVAGLMDGIKQISDEKITRDNAAQMICNALFADQVRPVIDRDQGVAYLVKYENKFATNNKLGKFVFDLTPVTAAVTMNAANDPAGHNAGQSTIGTKKNIATGIEDIGKNVTYYTFTKDGKTVNSTTAAVSSKVRVVAVPTDKLVDSNAPAAGEIDYEAWLASIGMTMKATGIKQYTNYYPGADYAAAAAKTALLAAGAAKTAYVIDNDTSDNKDEIDTVIINGLNTKVVSGDVKTATSGDTKTVYVPGITAGYVDVKAVVGYEGLKKNDVVFTMGVNSSAVTYISAAKSITGTITGYSADKIYVDGTAYEISPITGSMTHAQVKAMGTDDAATFWLDAAGKIAYAKGTVAVADSKLAVMVGYSAKADDGINATTATAKLLFTDGTTALVDVASVTGFGAIEVTSLVSSFKMVSFTINTDGKYVLVNAANDYDVIPVTDAAITNGKASGVMAGTGAATGFIGNASTAFITATVKDGKATGYTAVTGIAKAPTYAAGTTGADGIVVSSKGTAKLVFITNGSAVSAGSSTYLYTEKGDVSTYDAVKKTNTIEGYLDGVKGNIAIDKAVYAYTNSEKALYKVDITDGVVTGSTPVAFTLDALTGVSYSDGTLGVNTSANVATNRKYYTTNDKTVVFLKTGTTLTTISAANIESDTNDTVQAIANSDGVAEVVYITKVANSLANTHTAMGALIDCTNTKSTTTTAVVDAATAIKGSMDAIDADWTDAAHAVKAIDITTDHFIGFQFQAAAGKALTLTIKVEGVGASTNHSVTVTLPGGSIAPVKCALELPTGTTSLKFTVTATDGDSATAVTKVYTQAFADA